MTDSITVLMSTYNGEKYMREQIDSILNQKDVDVHLLVRDDGSSDSTLSILDDYKSRGLLDYYTGANLGPQRSFMHLLQNAPESDYYAFADQDDFWLDDKLSCAIGRIRSAKDRPALYFCQTQLTDENLNRKPSVIINPKLTFGESLIYKFIGGCTTVINNSLREIIGNKQPDYLRMHDTWVYSIAAAFDSYIYFDPTPHILYRQHGNNALGQGQGIRHEWKQRWDRFLNLKNDRYSQALELGRCYGPAIPQHNKRLLDEFIAGKESVVKRLGLIFNKELKCSDRTTQILFWCNLILNKY